VFERFTERAREAVALAQDEARSFGHQSVGTEHLLVGLLRQGTGAAARVLAGLDVTVEEVRAQIERGEGGGHESPAGEMPFAEDAKRALEHLAMREALSIGHNYVGTEHVLLGIAREGGGATRILLEFDVDLDMIRAEVVRLLKGVRRDAPGRKGDGEENQIVVDLAGPEGWNGTARRSCAPHMLALGLALLALAFGLGLLAGRRTRG
jgi:ATP-dependent Clp protease ATP-binding subunit ClpC